MPNLPVLLRPYLIVVLAAIVPQSAVLDQGTFMVSRNGALIGRETFRIVRSQAPGGQVFRATGQVARGDERIETSLGTDSAGVPVDYESRLFQRSDQLQHILGKGRPGRFSVFFQTKGGESVREYVLNNGALLMDEDVFHQFYFVPIAAQHAHLIVISPRSGVQERLELSDRGSDTLRLAGRPIPARHYALTGPENDTRDVWVDEKGRLLKVAIAAKGLVALRDDPPR